MTKKKLDNLFGVIGDPHRSSVLYVPVTGTIEDAFSELVFMKEAKENGEN